MLLLEIMIDPVKSSQIALTVNDEEKKVTATSFHYADAIIMKNLVLSASVTAPVLKTETSIGCDQFDEFVFSDKEDAPEGAEKEDADNYYMRCVSCSLPGVVLFLPVLLLPE